MSRNRQHGSIPLALAISLSAILHVGFLFSVQPPPEPRLQRIAKNPEVSFSILSDARRELRSTDTQSRALYSPVVFAFPTPVGFSASILNQTLRSPPPLPLESSAGFAMELGDRPERALTEVEGKDRERPGQNLLLSRKYLPDPASSGPHASESRFQVFARGPNDFSARMPSEWEAPEASQPWMGEIAIQISPSGQVTHALAITEDGEEGQQAFWARWAYRLRWSPDLQSTSGRLFIRWQPALGNREADDV